MASVRRLALDGLVEIVPDRHGDERGFLSETWSERLAAEAGIDHPWVQDNHSLSRPAGVLRGLHFQAPPMAQAKLVRVTRGAVFDVAVDLRPTSPTYRRWEAVTLSAERWNQLYVPIGFAHGFLTLEADSEVQYKVSTPYSREHDRALRWNDPAIGVDWPLAGDPILSGKDRAAPLLADIEGSP